MGRAVAVTPRLRGCFSRGVIAIKPWDFLIAPPKGRSMSAQAAKNMQEGAVVML